MQQNNVLAGVPRSLHQLQELLGLAELLDDHREHLRVTVVDQVIEKLLHSARGFVAGRNRVGNLQPMMAQADTEYGCHCSALRDNGDSAAGAEFLHRRGDKRQCDAVNVVGNAKTVRPFDYHAIFSGDLAQPLLFGPALLTGFGKSRGEDDDAAHLAACTCKHRLHHARSRYGEHRAIHTLR